MANPNSPSAFERVGRWLGGTEQVDETGLPVEEFAHPWPLLAMALLGVNDHLLKGSGWLPGWVTGKVSDCAGLLFVPLFLTAAVDTLLYLAFRLSRGRTPRYSLTMGKLYAAVAFTAILFVPLKLSDTWGTLYIRAMHVLDVFDWFGGFQVTRDPTDIVAVAMFPLVILLGRRFVRRIPMGRLAEISVAAQGRDPKERRRMVASGLADVRGLVKGSARRGKALDAFIDAFIDALGKTHGHPAHSRRQQAQQRLDGYRQALEQTG
jgi:hypothetical protein